MAPLGYERRRTSIVLIVLCFVGCNRPTTESPRQVEPAVRVDSSANRGLPESGDQLEKLRLDGNIHEFVDAAIRLGKQHPDDPGIQLAKTEAMLASGRNAEAEQSARLTIELARAADPPRAVQAAKLWTTARLRQGASLDDADFKRALSTLVADDPALRTLRFWGKALADRQPYRVNSPESKPVDVPVSPANPGSPAFALAAIEVSTNGTRQPIAFLDTGAQHTLMTTAAARAAGVRMDEAATQLTGFVGLEARPGLVESLELGTLIIHDVPVLVGDSPPLVTAGGQMTIGTDLMHHLRFTIDYPNRRVTAAPAAWEPRTTDAPPLWQIPVWTFSQICLARGETADGAVARVLVDTGDRAGTFVSYRWGRKHLPQLSGPNASLVFRFKKRRLALDALTLGSQSLADWPIADTIPPELDRLNVVDLMLGHDLLWPYELSIDLSRRMLSLQTAPVRDPRAPAEATSGPNAER